MYVKLFSSIYQGTLRGNSHGLLVFTNLLAHADREGFVDIHPRAISEEVGIPVDDVRKALLMLEEKDSESRTAELDGRRIVRIDEHRAWGWQIVNYVKYREIRNEDDRRQQNREAQQRWREKHKQVKAAISSVSTRNHVSAASAYAEVDADAGVKADSKASPKTKREGRKATSLPDDWVMPKEYREFCEQERPDLNPDKTGESFKDYWTGIAGDKGRKTNWFGAFKNWVRKERGQMTLGTARKPISKHSGFANMNYSEGVGDDGSF